MNSISEEKLKILLKNERSTCWAILVETALDLRTASTRMAWLVDLPFFNQFLIFLQELELGNISPPFIKCKLHNSKILKTITQLSIR